MRTLNSPRGSKSAASVWARSWVCLQAIRRKGFCIVLGLGGIMMFVKKLTFHG